MVKTITGIFVLIGICFSVYFWADDRYALAEDVKRLNQRFEYKSLFDQRQAVQERIWKLEDRYQGKPMPAVVKEEYRSLQTQKDQFDKLLGTMQQNQLKGR